MSWRRGERPPRRPPTVTGCAPHGRGGGRDHSVDGCHVCECSLLRCAALRVFFNRCWKKKKSVSSHESNRKKLSSPSVFLRSAQSATGARLKHVHVPPFGSHIEESTRENNSCQATAWCAKRRHVSHQRQRDSARRRCEKPSLVVAFDKLERRRCEVRARVVCSFSPLLSFPWRFNIHQRCRRRDPAMRVFSSRRTND
jgi:hypothetical protein